MATCLEAAGAVYPREFNGNQIQPLEGRSLATVFRGRRLKTRPLFWEHEGNRAVRQGQWKLVSKYPQSWELYDLGKDRSETKDMASMKPEITESLAALYDGWQARVGVTDWRTLQTSKEVVQRNEE